MRPTPLTSCSSSLSIDVFADVIVIALSADAFDDHAEHQKSIIAVLPAAARLKFRSALAIEFYVVLQRL